MIPELITNFVTFGGVLLILLTINWRLALITCCPIPLILLSGVVFAKRVRPYFKASQRSMGELNAKLQDNLSGLHEIQSFGQEDWENSRVSEKNYQQVRAMLRALRASAAFHPCRGIPLFRRHRPGGAVRRTVCLAEPAFRGGYRGLHAVSLAFLYACLRHGHFAGKFPAVACRGGACGAHPGNTAGIHDLPGARDLGRAQGAIAFEDVSFSYTEGVPVLRHVSFPAVRA